MKQYLAIDIGGTAVKLGIVDEEGRVLSKTEQSVCFDNYETPILTTVLSAAEQFLKEQAVEPQGLAGIGVSAAGQIDTRKGIVAGTCGSLPNYIGSPIKAELEAKFGLPTTVANDANCMTLGEVWVGGAKGYTDVIGVTLGTGVGGGILTGEVTRLIESAIRVIAVDQASSEGEYSGNSARTVTVAATPEQVARLAQAQATGKLSMSLVADSADGVEGLVEVDGNKLLGIEKQEVAAVEVEEQCTVKTRKGAEVVEIPIPCTN